MYFLSRVFVVEDDFARKKHSKSITVCYTYIGQSSKDRNVIYCSCQRLNLLWVFSNAVTFYPRSRRSKSLVSIFFPRKNLRCKFMSVVMFQKVQAVGEGQIFTPRHSVCQQVARSFPSAPHGPQRRLQLYANMKLKMSPRGTMLRQESRQHAENVFSKMFMQIVDFLQTTSPNSVRSSVACLNPHVPF